MANVSRSVDIIFGGKDQVSKVVRDVNRAIGSVETTITSIASPLAEFTDSLLKWEAALSGVVVAGLALATNEAGKFMDATAEINTLITATGANIDQFRSDILNYSRDSKKSIEDITSAIYQAVSLGADYKDVLAIMSDAEKLSIAGKADLTATTELLLGTLNAYGESVDRATHYSDVFFETVSAGKTTIPELARALSKITGVAANANIPIETLTAAIAALTAVGAPTSEAITGIRAVIASIMEPTSEAAELAGKLKIGFSATALQAKGLEGVLQDIYHATGGNVEQFNTLFSTLEAQNAALTLSVDKSGRFSEALKRLQSATGATAEAYKKMADGFALVNQNLVNNVKATLIEIGQPLLKSYSDVVGALADILKSIGAGVKAGAFDPLFNALKEFGTGIKELFEGIAKALPGALSQLNFYGLIERLRELGSVMFGFLDGLDPTKPEDLAIAIQKVIDTLESLTNITIGIVEFFQTVFRQISEFIDAVNTMDSGSQKAFGNVLGGVELIAKAGLKIALASMLIQTAGLDIGRTFEIAAGSITVLLFSLKGAFDTAALVIMGTALIAAKAWNIMTFGLSSKMLRAEKELSYVFNAIKQALLDTAQGVRDGIDILKDGFGKTKGIVTESAAVMRTHIAKLAESTRQGKDAWVEYRDTTERELGKSVKATAVAAAAITKNMGAIYTSLGNTYRISQDASGYTVFEKLSDEAESAKEKISDTSKIERASDRAQKKISEIPDLLDLEEFELKTDEIDSSLDFEATLDVDKFDASVDTMKSLIADTGDYISATAQAIDTFGANISDLYKTLVSPEARRAGRTSDIMDQIKAENKIREKQLGMQQELTDALVNQMEAQTKLLNTKIEKLASGNPVLEISAEGLKPHLEAFMWEILDAIQLRVNEEGADLLLGIS